MTNINIIILQELTLNSGHLQLFIPFFQKNRFDFAINALELILLFKLFGEDYPLFNKQCIFDLF
jgi:hypothetical protein